MPEKFIFHSQLSGTSVDCMNSKTQAGGTATILNTADAVIKRESEALY